MLGVPSDPALPALAALFPADGAPDFVCQAVNDMTGQDVQPRDGKLTYVRYRPTKNCVALWSFPAPEGTQIFVSTTHFRDDRGARIAVRRSFLALADSIRTANAQPNPPYCYLTDRRILVQVYPLDVRIPGLASAHSDAWCRNHLLPRLGLPTEAVESIRAHTVDFKPRHRCVLRYDISVRDDETRYFAKLFRDDRGEQFLPWMRTVQRELEATDAPWTIVRPAGYVPEASMLLLNEVGSAVELKTLMKQARGDVQITNAVRNQFAQAADGLGFLQQVDVNGLPAVTPRALLQRFNQSMEGFAIVDPAGADLVTNCLRILEDQASRLEPEPMVTSHGAFRHDQILIQDQRQVVLDLDTLCLSGPSADAGNFLSYLDVGARRRSHSEPVIRACAPAFEDRALRLSNTSPDWIAWHRSAGHVKKALRSYLSLDKKWPEMADAFLRPLAESGTPAGTGDRMRT